VALLFCSLPIKSGTEMSLGAIYTSTIALFVHTVFVHAVFVHAQTRQENQSRKKRKYKNTLTAA